jgi:hypothetical protein
MQLLGSAAVQTNSSLGCWAAYTGSCLPTFRERFSVESSMVKDFKLLYPKRCGRQFVLNVVKNYSFVSNLKQDDGEIVMCVSPRQHNVISNL